MRDGVQADMTALASTNESTIFCVHASSASALTSKTSTPCCSSSPTAPPDELGAEHGQLGVVDGHHRLLARRRHDEHVREASAHHAEQAGGAVGPLLGQGDAAATDDLVAGAAVAAGCSSASKPVP